MNKFQKILVLFVLLGFVFVLAGIALQQAEETVTCPVGGKAMKKSEAKASYEYKGKTYYFCSAECKEKFMKEPEKYIQKKAEMKGVYTCPKHPDVKSEKPGKCPHCGMELEKKMMTHEKMAGCMEMPCPMQMKEGEKPVCPMMSKDVEVNIENLPDGVSLKMTSKNAETVKKIQEHMAKMKTMCLEKKSCPQKEGIKK